MISASGALRILEEALADREPTVRRASVLSLEKLIQSSVLGPRNLFLETAFPWLIALAQKEQSLMVNMALVNTLSGTWRQEVPDAIEKILENTEGSKELLRKVVELVGQNSNSFRVLFLPLHPLDSEHRLPRWAREMLPELLWDGDPNVRAGSLILLDPLQKREHVEVIISRLRDDESVVRAKAVEALGRPGDPRAVEPLIEALRDPVNKEVRTKAVEAIRPDPDLARAYRDRGITWHVKREYDRAIADYNEAIRFDPKDALAYTNRGDAYANKQDYDRAIADYNEAIRLTWHAKREFDRAIAGYNEMRRLDPDLARAYRDRAWLWATCPDAKYRDGNRASASATLACEQPAGRTPTPSRCSLRPVPRPGTSTRPSSGRKWHSNCFPKTPRTGRNGCPA